MIRTPNFGNNIFTLILSCCENFINFYGPVIELLMEVLQTDRQTDVQRRSIIHSAFSGCIKMKNLAIFYGVSIHLKRDFWGPPLLSKVFIEPVKYLGKIRKNIDT